MTRVDNSLFSHSDTARPCGVKDLSARYINGLKEKWKEVSKVGLESTKIRSWDCRE